MWILYHIGRFPHFLDIRQFMGKPRNVDTLLYREVSTFLDIRQFMEKPRNVDTLLYREVSTFLDIRQFMEKPRNVDTLLYREISTFFDGETLNMWIPDYIGRGPLFKYNALHEKPPKM